MFITGEVWGLMFQLRKLAKFFNWAKYKKEAKGPSASIYVIHSLYIGKKKA